MTDPGVDAARDARCSIPVQGRRYDAVGSEEALTWMLPEEEPVAMVYNQESFAVMLATPADLEEFGLGFSLAERIIDHPAELEHLRVKQTEAGATIRMTIPLDRAAALAGRRRALEGRSGCGLCGVAELAAARRPARPVTAPRVSPAAVGRALRDLTRAQPMRAVNFSVHGAGWCGRDGSVLVVREDVGRHSALDKLIGAVFRQGFDPCEGFVALSSRCGYELVQKAAAVGIGLIASVSAPTSMALEQARGAGLALMAADRGGGVVSLC